MAEDPEDEQAAAEQRKGERTESVEALLREVQADLGDQQYPVSSEELGAFYADQTIDLPNETESVGSVFERIDDEFGDEVEAYDALVTEFERHGYLGDDPAGVADEPPYFEEEDAATQTPDEPDAVEEETYDESVADAQRRARETQAGETEEAGTAGTEADDGTDGERDGE